MVTTWLRVINDGRSNIFLAFGMGQALWYLHYLMYFLEQPCTYEETKSQRA